MNIPSIQITQDSVSERDPNSYRSLLLGAPHLVGTPVGEIIADANGAIISSVSSLLPCRPAKGVPKVYGNSLNAKGPHDVYVIRDRVTGRIYHFGETGRGWEIRGTEWVAKLRKEHGLDTVVEHLATVDGKAAARALETRYISTYEKTFGFKLGYVDAGGNFVQPSKDHALRYGTIDYCCDKEPQVWESIG